MGRTLSSVEADIAGRVAVLRNAGVPWDRIADALGINEPEVQRRFARPATT